MGEGTQGSSLRAAGTWLLLPIAAERKPNLPDVSWTSPFAWWSSQGHTQVIAHVQPGNLALGPPPRQVSQPAAQMWERGAQGAGACTATVGSRHKAINGLLLPLMHSVWTEWGGLPRDLLPLSNLPRAPSLPVGWETGRL